MAIHCLFTLPLWNLMFIVVTFLLQLVALTGTWWATYSSRTDLGKPKEDGHYGLWNLCSIKGPHWTEDCDPLDTFFEVPSFLQVARILCVVHLLTLLALLAMSALWTVQVLRNRKHLCMKSKTLCIVKVSVAFISVIVAILVAIFASVGENHQTEYFVEKAWSFWLQIAVICADIVITMICVIENIRFWQENMRQYADPDGTRAETYGNPSFDPDSPDLSRRNRNSNTNGVISYTETSGHPYDPNSIVNNSSYKLHSKKSGKEYSSQTPFNSKGKSNTLTYENECYQEHSPTSRRMRNEYYQ